MRPLRFRHPNLLTSTGALALFFIVLSGLSPAGSLDDLARPQKGRSMRETSTHKLGPDGKFDPNGVPDPNSNWDNKNVAPGQTKVLMDARVVDRLGGQRRPGHHGWRRGQGRPRGVVLQPRCLS